MLKLPAEVFAGVQGGEPTKAHDVDDVYRLVELVTPLPGDNLARLVVALEPTVELGDEWAEAFAFAALRLNKRLHPTAPEEAAPWLERALRVSEGCATQGAAMNWGLALFRTVRRAGEQNPSRLLEVSRQMLSQATKWAEPSLTTNTLDLALGAAYALVSVGRDEEALALCNDALALPRIESDSLQRWLAFRFARELGLIERRRGHLGAATDWYLQARARWRPKIKDAPGELAWLLAEEIHVARLQGKPELVLQHADDFARELGTTKDKWAKEEAEFVWAERALALVQVGRLDEVEGTLERLPARPAMVATRSLVLRVRVMLAQARGDLPAARKLAKQGLKTFAGKESDCHDDLEFFNSVHGGCAVEAGVGEGLQEEVFAHRARDSTLASGSSLGKSVMIKAAGQ